jgi:hypothetical protein
LGFLWCINAIKTNLFPDTTPHNGYGIAISYGYHLAIKRLRRCTANPSNEV